MNREPTFNYILNDLAFLNLQTKVIYGEPTEQDLFDFEYQLKLKEKENKQLQQENKKYKEVIDKLRKSIDECWYMDSENVGEQVFLKKCELLDILKEVE